MALTPIEIMGKIVSTLSRSDWAMDKQTDIYNIIDGTQPVNDIGVIDVDTTSLSKNLELVQIYERQVRDNTATVNNLSRQVPIDESYYTSAVKTFLKKALFISTTLPTMIYTAIPLHFSVVIKNGGMFFSWNEEKNIHLQVKILDADDVVVFETTYPLDLSIPANIPKDEVMSADTGVNKIFNVTMTLPEEIYHPADYSVVFQVTDGIDFFDSKYKYNIQIL